MKYDIRYEFLLTLISLSFLQDGTTPLILAAAGGHIDAVVELLQQGADANAKRLVSYYHHHSKKKRLDPILDTLNIINVRDKRLFTNSYTYTSWRLAFSF